MRKGKGQSGAELGKGRKFVQRRHTRRGGQLRGRWLPADWGERTAANAVRGHAPRGEGRGYGCAEIRRLLFSRSMSRMSSGIKVCVCESLQSNATLAESVPRRDSRRTATWPPHLLWFLTTHVPSYPHNPLRPHTHLLSPPSPSSSALVRVGAATAHIGARPSASLYSHSYKFSPLGGGK